MKHQTLNQLLSIAEVHPEPTHVSMTRNQRLERWAELLERNPDRALAALEGTERQSREARHVCRASDSPITVAFEDPLLRAEGMQNDTYGEAKSFFELSDWRLHEIVCDCRTGSTMQASRAARQVRKAVGGGWASWLRKMFFLASRALASVAQSISAAGTEPMMLELNPDARRRSIKSAPSPLRSEAR